MNSEQRFIIEITKALVTEPRVLILDEPTEHLLIKDVERLFGHIRRVAASGTGIVYISHRIREVKRITDRITVLRDGITRGTFSSSELSETQIVELIVGKELEHEFPPKPQPVTIGQPALRITEFRGQGFGPVSLEVRRGGIFGLGGMDADGKREFMRALAGIEASTGTVVVDGAPVSVADSKAASVNGIRYLSGSRAREGIFSSPSVRKNFSYRSLGLDAVAGFVRGTSERDRARDATARFDVKTPTLDTPIASLSGGNQQKVTMAGVLAAKPKIAFALLAVASAVVAPGTLKIGSIAAMLPFASMPALVAASQTLVIQQHGLDLSAAALVGLGGILLAKCSALFGPPFPAVLASLVACGCFGAVNGVLVARIGISAIVATLASGAALSGVARRVTAGSALPIPTVLQNISHAAVLGVPTTVVVTGAIILGMPILVERTVVGRRFIAVGVNRPTAIASGTPATRYEVGTYAIAGMLYALAGMLLASFIGYASATAGDDYLLASIAAVVVGGTSFAGGKGSLIPTGAAALFLTQLGQMVLALGAGTAQQLFVQAAAIIIAVSLRRIPFGAIRRQWGSAKHR